MAGGSLAHGTHIEFDDFGWSRLVAEAERQGVTVEELLVHAAMYYLADLDSGRVAARVLREAERKEDDPESPPGRRFERPGGEEGDDPGGAG